MLGAILACRLEENDKIVLTPFEKNIDIWRQLWRVVERSDLVSNAPPSLPLSPTDLVTESTSAGQITCSPSVRVLGYPFCFIF